MNWMIIVGGICLFSGIVTIFSDFFAAVSTIVVGAVLLFFGLRKKEKQKSREVLRHTPVLDTPNNSYQVVSIDPRKRFISFDLETTGLSPNNDRIIEISAVIFEDCIPCDCFSSLINPGIPIPVAASKINHIYDADVAAAPTEKEVIQQFCDFVGPAALRGEISLVAHNAQFDAGFLSQALKRCGISANFLFSDTLKLCRESHVDLPDKKLGTIAKYFDIVQHDAHRAADDARVCGEVFVRLMNLNR